jgi:uncharacterized membrane protein
MRVKAIAAWIWSLLVLVGWCTISVINRGELTTFGIPAALTLILGALIWSRVEENRIGLLMLIAGSAWLLYDGCRQYASLSLESGPFAFEYLAAWLGTWTGPLFFVSFPTLLLLFPDGRAPGFCRWVLLLPLLVLALVAIGAGSIWGLPVEVLINDDLVSPASQYQWIDAAFIIALYSIIPATPSIIGRYRKGDLVRRQQIRWLVAGSIAFAIGLLVGSFASGGEGPAWWDVVVVAGMTSFPLAIGVAIFRYKLYDLGRLLSRTATYAIVISLLGLAIAGVAAVAGAQFKEPLVVAATTLAVAALFNPLRRKVQGWVERRFNRSRYDAESVMDEFAASLRNRVDTDDVIDGWVGVVENTMQPAAIRVWVKDSR